MMIWELLRTGVTAETLGLIPSFLADSDARPAREQFNERYAHGGGWYPINGCKLDIFDLTLHYPGDPPLTPIARLKFRDETILLYDYAFVLIMQQDHSFEVARMD